MKPIRLALLMIAILVSACGKKESPSPAPAAPAPASGPLLPETPQPTPPPPAPPGGTAIDPSAGTAAQVPVDDAPTVIAIQELNTALRNYVSAKGKFPSSIEELCKDPALVKKKFQVPPGKHFVIDQRGMQVTLSN